MRIAVDGGTWASPRGYGRFIREILPPMVRQGGEHEWLVLLDAEAAERFEASAPNLRVVPVGIDAPGRGATAYGYRSPRDLARLSMAVLRQRPDVFFSPSVYTYFPLPPGQRAVVTVHDTIPERFPELTLPTRRSRWFWNAKVRLAVRQAKLILTVSEYSAREIATVLRVPRERIRVADEAQSPVYRPATDAAEIAAAAARFGIGPGERWFVYVGGYNPHKRVDLLVKAHARVAARSNGRPPHLLLVGPVAEDRFYQSVAEVRRAIDEGGAADLVHWTGFIDDAVLRQLHTGALAVVLPSMAEGFGLPAVEGAACGAAVIATTASPLPELLAGGGLFVDPGDEDALAAAMERLANEPALRDRLGARARERAAALSWERGARAALACLEEAAA